MAEPTRQKYDAKLEAAEARLETRLVAIDGKLDRLFGRMGSVATDVNEARKAASGIKWNILATTLAVVAVLFAAWAIWVQGIEMVSGIIGAVSDPSAPTK